MAGQDYVPIFDSGTTASCTAGAAITAGQLVYISGGTLSSGTVTPTVTPTTAATSAEVGVASQTVASGQPVTVYFGGVHLLTASGTINAGDPVVAAASGAVADLGAGTTYDQVVGHAWSASASNQVAVRLGEI